jgi:hypothetical protein
MKNFQKYFVAVAMAITLIVPQLAIAQTKTPTNTTTGSGATTTDQCEFLKNQLINGGFSVTENKLPEYCTPGRVYKKFISVAFYAIGIVAVIAVIYGGYLYMTSAGNEAQTKKGRSVLIWAIIGLVVVLAAAVIVNIVIDSLIK